MELNSANLSKTLKSVGVLKPLENVVDQFNISLSHLSKFNDHFETGNSKQSAATHTLTKSQVEKMCSETSKVLSSLSSNEYFHLMFYNNLVTQLMKIYILFSHV